MEEKPGETLNPWKMPGFKPGQSVSCTVIEPEEGDFTVSIKDSEISGFLPTEAHLVKGDELEAHCVCFHKSRMLLSARLVALEAVLENRSKMTRWSDNPIDPPLPPLTDRGA
jgi:hypothetical protein